MYIWIIALVLFLLLTRVWENIFDALVKTGHSTVLVGIILIVIGGGGYYLSSLLQSNMLAILLGALSLVFLFIGGFYIKQNIFKSE